MRQYLLKFVECQMEVSFKSKKHERILGDDRLLLKTYGENARDVKKCHQLLVAATRLADLTVARVRRCHQLSGDREDCFAMDDKQPFRFVFMPTPPVPRKEDGGIDCGKVVSVVVVDPCVDYH